MTLVTLCDMNERYYVYVNDESRGPYSLAQLKEMWRGGNLPANTLICQEGASEWAELSTIENRFQEGSTVAAPTMVPGVTQKLAPTKATQQSQALAGCFVLFVLITLAVGGFLIWTQFPNSSSSSTPSVSSATSSSTESVSTTESDAFSGEADDLFRQYSANEVNADNHYKDHPATVSGDIVSIGKDILDTPYIVVGGSGFIDGVQCMFDRNNNPVASLTKGQSVTVHGTVKGKMGNVLLENCSLR